VLALARINGVGDVDLPIANVAVTFPNADRAEMVSKAALKSFYRIIAFFSG
jgi:hypothetical protein